MFSYTLGFELYVECWWRSTTIIVIVEQHSDNLSLCWKLCCAIVFIGILRIYHYRIDDDFLPQKFFYSLFASSFFFSFCQAPGKKCVLQGKIDRMKMIWPVISSIKSVIMVIRSFRSIDRPTKKNAIGTKWNFVGESCGVTRIGYYWMCFVFGTCLV